MIDYDDNNDNTYITKIPLDSQCTLYIPGALPDGSDWLSHVKPVLEKRMQK